MKIFVIGGEGFIGNLLVEKPVKENNEVSIINNFSSGTFEKANIIHRLERTIKEFKITKIAAISTKG